MVRIGRKNPIARQMQYSCTTEDRTRVGKKAKRFPTNYKQARKKKDRDMEVLKLCHIYNSVKLVSTLTLLIS